VASARVICSGNAVWWPKIKPEVAGKGVRGSLNGCKKGRSPLVKGKRRGSTNPPGRFMKLYDKAGLGILGGLREKGMIKSGG